MRTLLSALCLGSIVLFVVPQSVKAQNAVAPTHSGTAMPATDHPGGRVIDSLSGGPVAGATIEIGSVGLTQTDNAGYFEFRRLRPGSYAVKVSSAGYVGYEATLSLEGGSPVEIRLS